MTPAEAMTLRKDPRMTIRKADLVGLVSAAVASVGDCFFRFQAAVTSEPRVFEFAMSMN